MLISTNIHSLGPLVQTLCGRNVLKRRLGRYTHRRRKRPPKTAGVRPPSSSAFHSHEVQLRSTLNDRKSRVSSSAYDVNMMMR